MIVAQRPSATPAPLITRKEQMENLDGKLEDRSRGLETLGG